MCKNTSELPLLEIVKISIPILLFFLGIYFTKIVESSKEKRRLKKIKIYFFELLIEFQEKIELEIDLIGNCIQRIKNWNETNLVLNKTGHRVSERILELKQEDLFKIFTNQKKGSSKEKVLNYHNISKNIDYLILIFPNINETNIKEIEKINRFNEIWNKSHNEMTKFMNELISINNKKGVDSFTDNFVSIYESFNSKHNRIENIETAYLELVLPLIDFCKTYSSDFRSSKLMTSCEQHKETYNQIKRIKERHLQFLEKTSEDLVEIKGRLGEILLNK